MRDIKFRGKEIATQKWVVGDLVHCKYTTLIYPLNGGWDEHFIIPETVGQFTGLKDKNGTEIYEGDIVLVYDYRRPRKYIVNWRGSGFILGETMALYYNITNIEVIGNIHDNPELLKGGME